LTLATQKLALCNAPERRVSRTEIRARHLSIICQTPDRHLASSLKVEWPLFEE
jgi:hypothetical protein